MGLGSVSGTRVRRRFSRWCGLPVLLTLLVAGLTATARADTPTSAQGSAAGPGAVPSPSVRGPIPWSYGIQKQPETDSLFDLTPFGYSEKEYFVSGTAAYHANPGSLDSAPGATTPAPTAPYTIRMIVRAPRDPGRFNGTVAVEWNNVTAQFDETPVWDWTYPTVLRAGTAFVIVSVQQAGYCCSPLSLKVHDPVRYGSMNQPGDGYAFSIYSQVLQSLRHPVGLDPMGGLHVNRLLAAGESQS
ncbi:MAG TPA: alpha/beta hydrolase domain-containing protein, partial [Acidimicrobiales bacterium]|nr:alpha/beta hydrolase domain-containing protein [Acidimicrobiales bacterium]